MVHGVKTRTDAIDLRRHLVVLVEFYNIRRGSETSKTTITDWSEKTLRIYSILLIDLM